jgi:hypothetical protein
MEMSGQLHAPAALPPEEITPSTHWIGGWVGPGAGPDAVENPALPGIKPGPSSP